jgi:hypothetical protein
VELDAVLDEVGMEVLNLLFGDLCLRKCRCDFGDQQVPTLLTDVDELAELLDVGKLDIDGQHRPPRLQSMLTPQGSVIREETRLGIPSLSLRAEVIAPVTSFVNLVMTL